MTLPVNLTDKLNTPVDTVIVGQITTVNDWGYGLSTEKLIMPGSVTAMSLHNTEVDANSGLNGTTVDIATNLVTTIPSDGQFRVNYEDSIYRYKIGLIEANVAQNLKFLRAVCKTYGDLWGSKKANAINTQVNTNTININDLLIRVSALESGITYPRIISNNQVLSVTGGNVVALKGGLGAITEESAGLYYLKAPAIDGTDKAAFRFETAKSLYLAKIQQTYNGLPDNATYFPLVALTDTTVPESLVDYTDFTSKRKVYVTIKKSAGNLILSIAKINTSGTAEYWTGSAWTTTNTTITISDAPINISIERTSTDYIISIKSSDDTVIHAHATTPISGVRGTTGNDYVFSGDPMLNAFNIDMKIKLIQMG